jgi:predicted transport protein
MTSQLLRLACPKFVSSNPDMLILAGAAETHSVCVRVQHQNVKLMADAIKLNELPKEMNLEKNVLALKHVSINKLQSTKRRLYNE